MAIVAKPGNCSCICHIDHYDQHAAMYALYRMATLIMPPMPEGANVNPLVEGVDGALDDMVQEANVVKGPRIGAVVSRIWRGVVFPARCAWRDSDKVAARAVRGEDSDQTSDEERQYLDGIQRDLIPYIREIHAIAVDHHDRDEWAAQIEAADAYLEYCEATVGGPAVPYSDEIASLLGS